MDTLYLTYLCEEYKYEVVGRMIADLKYFYRNQTKDQIHEYFLPYRDDSHTSRIQRRHSM